MKIFVTGTRGIPNIPGGVETHCQELYPRLVELGNEVTIIRRDSYIHDNLKEYKGIKLVDLYSPEKKSLEAIVHTFLAILYALKHKPDVIHFHAIGPSLLVPIAKLIGFKVIVTNHGPDYDRGKWGKWAKRILKLGEKLGSKYADSVIVISEKIQKIVLSYKPKKTFLIYNGVDKQPVLSHEYLDKYNLDDKSYIFTAARFVPEKGLHDLIDAYNLSGLEYKLVIAGDADHEDQYSSSLKAKALENSNIILTGYITGNELAELFSHALLYVIPSYHEGLPITLLEALSYGVNVLASDIDANKEVGLVEQFYFKCGDIKSLADSLVRLSGYSMTESDKKHINNLLISRFNWDIIAKQTNDVYEYVLK